MLAQALVRQVTFFATRAFRSDDDVLLELKATLKTLADIACRHEGDRERMEHMFGALKPGDRLWVERERRYEKEREPHLRRLEQLESYLRWRFTSGF